MTGEANKERGIEAGLFSAFGTGEAPGFCLEAEAEPDFTTPDSGGCTSA